MNQFKIIPKLLSLSAIMCLLISCESKLAQPAIEKEEIKSEYSFSPYYPIDFNVCGATYSIIYKNKRAIDTALTYSGVFFIGKDSLLYVQVRSWGKIKEKEYEANEISGEVTALMLFDGTDFQSLKLPYFDLLFSAFYADTNAIFYWGFTEESDSTFACKYNIKKQKLEKVFLTGLNWGTDFIAMFNPPVLNDDGTVELKSEISNRWWIINKSFDKIINYRLNLEDTTVVENENEDTVSTLSTPYVN